MSDFDQWHMAWDEFKSKRTPSEDTLFVYRGQAVPWRLRTSFERATVHSAFAGVSKEYLEEDLIGDFKRRFHHYSSRIPDDADGLEWLSWMQHFGAPTRLLDWTYSRYVAAFFALETAEDESGRDAPGAIWRLNVEWCNGAARKVVDSEHIELVDRVFRHDPYAFNRLCFVRPSFPVAPSTLYPQDLPSLLAEPVKLVLPVNPFRLNERLSVQQGLFLCPGMVGAPFEDNLRAMDGWELRENVTKIILPAQDRLRAISELRRMNMTAVTLFPGLEGFSRSLRTKMFLLKELLPPS